MIDILVVTLLLAQYFGLCVIADVFLISGFKCILQRQRGNSSFCKQSEFVQCLIYCCLKTSMKLRSSRICIHFDRSNLCCLRPGLEPLESTWMGDTWSVSSAQEPSWANLNALAGLYPYRMISEVLAWFWMSFCA